MKYHIDNAINDYYNKIINPLGGDGIKKEELIMHEGKHGILDDVDDMDALFGADEEECKDCKPGKPCEKHKHGHGHDHDHGHKHDHK